MIGQVVSTIILQFLTLCIKTLAPYLSFTRYRHSFKNLLQFQIKPDDLKAKLDHPKTRKNEECLQYLADNNLQDTYAPTNGKIFLLKCVIVTSMTNLFLLNIRICIQIFVEHFYIYSFNFVLCF